MRIFPHALLILLAAGVGCSAQDSKQGDTKRPKFWLGDAAPAISGAKWLQGKETKFEKDKVYVVEFWATWCRPCIQSMPHLAKLQEEYGKQGLQIIAVTTADEDGNTQEAVEEFLKKRGAKFPFPFAFCTGEATNTAWRENSGTDSLPSSFVIDGAGKLAFIGHPTDLDDVLPRVFAGTWKGQASIDEIEKEKAELDDLLNLIQDAAKRAEKANAGKGSDVVTKAIGDAAAEAATEILRVLPNYEKKWPIKAKQPIFEALKLAVTLQARQFDAGATLTESMLKKAIAAKDPVALDQVRSFWSTKSLNPDRKRIEFATTAADEILKIEGETDIGNLLGAAEAYYAAGKKDKADEYANKARKLVGDDEKSKAAIEKAIKRFQD
jgi:thiol-disulfide isomerase/thioredoxin